MMNRNAFENNLAELVVTDDMTVAEAKDINRKKKALVNKVKKNLMNHVRALDDKDYTEAGGYFFQFPNFKLKSNGSVTVRVMFDVNGWSDPGAFTFRSIDNFVREHRVNMKEILH